MSEQSLSSLFSIRHIPAFLHLGALDGISQHYRRHYLKQNNHPQKAQQCKKKSGTNLDYKKDMCLQYDGLNK